HFYRCDVTNPGSHDVTVRRLHVTGTQQAIILWNETLKRIAFDTVDVTDVKACAVRYEPYGDGTGGNATGIVLARITSTGIHASGFSGGFYSSQGANPLGVTFVDDHF